MNVNFHVMKRFHPFLLHPEAMPGGGEARHAGLEEHRDDEEVEEEDDQESAVNEQ